MVFKFCFFSLERQIVFLFSSTIVNTKKSIVLERLFICTLVDRFPFVNWNRNSKTLCEFMYYFSMMIIIHDNISSLHTYSSTKELTYFCYLSDWIKFLHIVCQYLSPSIEHRRCYLFIGKESALWLISVFYVIIEMKREVFHLKSQDKSFDFDHHKWMIRIFVDRKSNLMLIIGSIIESNNKNEMIRHTNIRKPKNACISFEYFHSCM